MIIHSGSSDIEELLAGEYFFQFSGLILSICGRFVKGRSGTGTHTPVNYESYVAFMQVMQVRKSTGSANSKHLILKAGQLDLAQSPHSLSALAIAPPPVTSSTMSECPASMRRGKYNGTISSERRTSRRRGKYVGSTTLPERVHPRGEVSKQGVHWYNAYTHCCWRCPLLYVIVPQFPYTNNVYETLLATWRPTFGNMETVASALALCKANRRKGGKKPKKTL